jgi:hypothetical protein
LCQRVPEAAHPCAKRGTPLAQCAVLGTPSLANYLSPLGLRWVFESHLRHHVQTLDFQGFFVSGVWACVVESPLPARSGHPIREPSGPSPRPLQDRLTPLKPQQQVSRCRTDTSSITKTHFRSANFLSSLPPANFWHSAF